jgi:hypothetical protein
MKRILLVNMKLQSCRTVATFSYFYLGVKIFSLIAFVLAALCTTAQSTSTEQKSDYKKVITERVSKIVNTLSLTDSVKYKEVVSIISDQYFSLNNVQEQNELAIADIKKELTDKEKQAEAVKTQEGKKSAELMQLHTGFIAHLKDNLTDGQVEQVKDGMTYRILPITYAAYEDMLPGLTAEQKTKIYGWLTEARELAMDAASSDKKHAVFGKYKGKINNYLSGMGYDMKKEGEAWQKRIKEKQEKKNEPGN